MKKLSNAKLQKLVRGGFKRIRNLVIASMSAVYVMSVKNLMRVVVIITKISMQIAKSVLSLNLQII